MVQRAVLVRLGTVELHRAHNVCDLHRLIALWRIGCVRDTDPSRGDISTVTVLRFPEEFTPLGSAHYAGAVIARGMGSSEGRETTDHDSYHH
jgi:hypothetical protein